MTSIPFPPPEPSAVAARVATPPPPPVPPRLSPARPTLPSGDRAAAPPPGGPPPGGRPPKPRRVGPLAFVLAALAVAMVVIVAAALPVLQDDDAAQPASDAAERPTPSIELRPQPSVEAADTPVEAEAAPAPVDVAEPAPEVAVETTIAIIPVAPEPAEEAGAVPESKAVVRGGQIFLEGAVPTAESGELIATLAAEILGPDNVFNNYVVDPRASDPNLGNVTVEDTINFATWSSLILPESEGLLNQALALMTIRPSVTVVVVGHTDSRGSDEYNVELSLQRAEAVKAWLTDRGVDGSRLTIVGKGESEPIADNSTSAGQRLNRRIQFFLENLLADS